MHVVRNNQGVALQTPLTMCGGKWELKMWKLDVLSLNRTKNMLYKILILGQIPLNINVTAILESKPILQTIRSQLLIENRILYGFSFTWIKNSKFKYPYLV